MKIIMYINDSITISISLLRLMIFFHASLHPHSHLLPLSQSGQIEIRSEAHKTKQEIGSLPTLFIHY